MVVNCCEENFCSTIVFQILSQQIMPFTSTPMSSSSLQYAIKLLKQSADSRSLRFGKSVHAQLVVSRKYALEDGMVLSNSLINLYAKCGEMGAARHLFGRMPNRNVVSWSALMAGYSHRGLYLEVIGLFRSMGVLDYLSPNEYVLATVLSACSDGERVCEGQQCHGHAVKSGLEFYQYVKNALILMYSKCSEVERAMRVFNMVPGWDNFSYNLVMNGLLEHGHLKEASGILSRMVSEETAWDSVSYVSAFGLCSRLKDLKLGLQVHNRIVKTNVEFDAYVASASIDMYSRCGKLSSAMKVFNSQEIKNVVLWTAILAAYFQNGCFEEALNLFFEMELVGVLPNEYSFAVLLNCCAGLSALRLGCLLHARVWKAGLKDFVSVGNALINMYSKCGNIEASREVFSNMIFRDPVTWNVMISGFSHHGLGNEALRVFYDMLAVKEHPNYITFVGVLSACGHLGRVQEGFYYLNILMRQMGIEPGLEHHTCIVGLLSKAGLLDEAENFMKSTPVEWDVVAWRSLLSACHVNRNYRLGRRVADMILQVDPGDVGTYVLLSNIYAKAKRWDGVVKMRKLMREKNIKKEPGVSWIEIRNKTHVFASEDDRHPESSMIHEKVRELLAKIRLLGYVPDISSVLHDVEQEQKEDDLVHHSEKLAIAYGIMKTPSAAPLHIIKNLRMCDDCHSAVKFISKATSRVIIVRDANRFHNFQNGNCSCADYW